jgi:hypothetical protein
MTMASCKDCVHYELCFDYTHLKHGKNLLPDNREDICEHFKNKADVVEVKHGYWIKTDELAGIEFLKCSVCGKAHPRVRTEYCCDCGAKMDG